MFSMMTMLVVATCSSWVGITEFDGPPSRAQKQLAIYLSGTFSNKQQVGWQKGASQVHVDPFVKARHQVVPNWRVVGLPELKRGSIFLTLRRRGERTRVVELAPTSEGVKATYYTYAARGHRVIRYSALKQDSLPVEYVPMGTDWGSEDCFFATKNIIKDDGSAFGLNELVCPAGIFTQTRVAPPGKPLKEGGHPIQLLRTSRMMNGKGGYVEPKPRQASAFRVYARDGAAVRAQKNLAALLSSDLFHNEEQVKWEQYSMMYGLVLSPSERHDFQVHVNGVVSHDKLEGLPADRADFLYVVVWTSRNPKPWDRDSEDAHSAWMLEVRPVDGTQASLTSYNSRNLGIPAAELRYDNPALVIDAANMISSDVFSDVRYSRSSLDSSCFSADYQSGDKSSPTGVLSLDVTELACPPGLYIWEKLVLNGNAFFDLQPVTYLRRDRMMSLAVRYY